MAPEILWASEDEVREEFRSRTLSGNPRILFTRPKPSYGDLIPIEQFDHDVRGKCFSDYDGHGYFAKKVDGKMKLNTFLSH